MRRRPAGRGACCAAWWTCCGSRFRRRFLVRLDGGFASPGLLDRLDAEPALDYVVAMAENPVLARHVESALIEARSLSERSGQPEHLYRGAVCRPHVAGRAPRRHQSGSRPSRRSGTARQRAVCHHESAANARFVYEQVYCGRSDIENRIKELHDGLQIGRTSCCRFWANQLRVLLTAAAYVLMQELRVRAAHTACARAQVSTLRERLLKVSAHVVVSVRRIVLHLPRSTPDVEAWRHVAGALGACCRSADCHIPNRRPHARHRSGAVLAIALRCCV
jgi:hypothetical protein